MPGRPLVVSHICADYQKSQTTHMKCGSHDEGQPPLCFRVFYFKTLCTDRQVCVPSIKLLLEIKNKSKHCEQKCTLQICSLVDPLNKKVEWNTSALTEPRTTFISSVINHEALNALMRCAYQTSALALTPTVLQLPPDSTHFSELTQASSFFTITFCLLPPPVSLCRFPHSLMLNPSGMHPTGIPHPAIVPPSGKQEHDQYDRGMYV